MNSTHNYKIGMATQLVINCLSMFAFLVLIAPAIVSAFEGDRQLLREPAKKDMRGTGEKMVNRILTEEDNGREVEINVGDIIRFDLRYQGGTGYVWYPDLPNDDSVRLVDSRSVDLSEQGMVGGPSIGMWYFKANAPGNTELTMLHYRVWEGRTKATKRFSVKLRVIDIRGKK